MKPPIISSLKKVLVYSAFWSLVFAVPATVLIDNHFVPIKKSFILKKNEDANILIPLEGEATILLQVKVPFHDPGNHPGCNSLSILVNGREINDGRIKKYYTLNQINFIVPGSYLRSKDGNEIIVRLPSPQDNPFIAPYIKIFNYKHISPNIPVSFIILDPENNSRISSGFPWKARKFSRVFFIVFVSFLFYQAAIWKIDLPCLRAVHSEL